MLVYLFQEHFWTCYAVLGVATLIGTGFWAGYSPYFKGLIREGSLPPPFILGLVWPVFWLVWGAQLLDQWPERLGRVTRQLVDEREERKRLEAGKGNLPIPDSDDQVRRR